MSDVSKVPPSLLKLWRDMEGRYEPRNADAIRKAREAGQLGDAGIFVVSYVDRTDLPYPHVFVTSGRAYDWRFAAGLRAWVVLKPGVDAGKVIPDLNEVLVPYVGLIDVERQVIAEVVTGARGLKLWPYRRGCEQWQAVFG